MPTDITQYLVELTGIDKPKVDVKTQSRVLERIYCGLLDNSPDRLASFLNYTEMLGLARELYIQRTPGMPLKHRDRFELAEHLIIEGEKHLLDIYPDRQLTPESAKLGRKLNPFGSSSLQERLRYGFEHEGIEQSLNAYLQVEAKDYLPNHLSWKKESEPEEHYELFPAISQPVGKGKFSEALGLINGITAESNQLISKDKFSLTKYRQDKFRETPKGQEKEIKLYEQAEEDDLRQQRIRELKEDYGDDVDIEANL